MRKPAWAFAGEGGHTVRAAETKSRCSELGPIASHKVEGMITSPRPS